MHNHLKTKSLTIERILNAAKELIMEEGLCSFRLSQIPTRAQCSTKTFYNHFKSKEDLVSALFIENFNFVLENMRQLISMDSLSYKQKVIYIHMFDVIKSWSETSNDVCVSFLGANPHVYGVSSPEYEGNIDVVFIELKQMNEQLWSNALKSGELLSSKQEIIDCIFSMRTIERGSIIMGQNKFLRQHGHNNSIKTIFNLLCTAMNTLNWKDQSPISFNDMFEIVSPLAQADRNSTFQHYKLTFDTLSDPMEL
ncbi:TetR/AcrR family transcriptional regulator [Shewanella youngdeokensis]|uniref:TetR/AcrR family transcriptional regulator n=1 Tax=Shewanella youngdeokensis TaxID=2999068 RepID=A0ABZ0JTE2_9GAMM|nr:TetR/AcrR family transcriptional regulator [Shewanella sp. DAU334]